MVNVASECGFTDEHYTDLVGAKLSHDEHFEVLAFPSNQFGNQEPKVSLESFWILFEKYILEQFVVKSGCYVHFFVVERGNLGVRQWEVPRQLSRVC